MPNELLELCPVQFIESMNDNEEINKQSTIDLLQYGIIAIAYKPKLSYCLTKLEIMLAHRLAVPDMKPIKVALHPEYKDKPSKVIIAEGEATPEICKEPHRLGFLWQEIELSPAVVIHNNSYWLSIDCNMSIHLVTATDGDITTLAYRDDNEWKRDTDYKEWKCMLRFYGRILPTVT